MPYAHTYLLGVQLERDSFRALSLLLERIAVHPFILGLIPSLFHPSLRAGPR